MYRLYHVAYLHFFCGILTEIKDFILILHLSCSLSTACGTIELELCLQFTIASPETQRSKLEPIHTLDKGSLVKEY